MEQGGGSGNLEVFAGDYRYGVSLFVMKIWKGSENWGIEILWKHLLVFKRSRKEKRSLSVNHFCPCWVYGSKAWGWVLRKAAAGRMESRYLWAGSEGLDCERGCGRLTCRNVRVLPLWASGNPAAKLMLFCHVIGVFLSVEYAWFFKIAIPIVNMCPSKNCWVVPGNLTVGLVYPRMPFN